MLTVYLHSVLKESKTTLHEMNLKKKKKNIVLHNFHTSLTKTEGLCAGMKLNSST